MPIPNTAIASCLFCQVVNRKVPARLVFEDEISLAFLDHRPVFPGHCLLIPKAHYETLADLPENLIGPYFRNVQLDRKSTRLNSSHQIISYAVFCLKKTTQTITPDSLDS